MLSARLALSCWLSHKCLCLCLFVNYFVSRCVAILSSLVRACIRVTSSCMSRTRSRNVWGLALSWLFRACASSGLGLRGIILGIASISCLPSVWHHHMGHRCILYHPWVIYYGIPLELNCCFILALGLRLLLALEVRRPLLRLWVCI